MKILWIARWDPRDPTDGALLYSKGMLDGVCESGAEIQVVTYAGESQGRVVGSVNWSIDALQPAAAKPRVLSLLTALQSDAYRHRSRAMERAIEKHLTPDIDAVVFDYFATGWALPIVQRHQRAMGAKAPVLVYLSHNHEASLRKLVAKEFSGSAPMRAVLRLDAAKGARMEARLVAAVDIVTANSDSDSALFEKDAPDKTHLTLVPAYSGTMELGAEIGPDRPRQVLMMGSLEWIAKQENLRRFVAAAESSFAAAGIELVVLGKSDQAFLGDIQSHSSVCKCLGFVNDPEPWIKSSRIGLMPDEVGGGFKHRYLNYIFNGLPVATIRSGVVGLPLDADKAMIVGDDAAELVREIVSLIDDYGELNARRHLAFEACKTGFDWRSRGQALADAIKKVRGARAE